jgi:hypothetical protein
MLRAIFGQTKKVTPQGTASSNQSSSSSSSSTSSSSTSSSTTDTPTHTTHILISSDYASSLSRISTDIAAGPLNSTNTPTIKNEDVDDDDEYEEVTASSINNKVFEFDDEDDWQVVAKPPAKVRFIKNLNEYQLKKDKGAKNTAHEVFPIKQNGLHYFFKKIHNPYMVYLEAYANHRYRMMLPGKVAPTKAYLDDVCNPVGVCSKGIPNFKTLKDKGKEEFIKWFKDFLHNKKNRNRLIEILAVAVYRQEDDLHGGNIAIDEKTGELFLFDTDCSMWPLMHQAQFKGPRAGIDGYTRNPLTDFALSEDDIRYFPNLKKAKFHYFPGKQAEFPADLITKPLVKMNTDNLYLDEIVELVQGLDTKSSREERREILSICFRVWLKEMLCGKEITVAIAKLHIPEQHNLSEPDIIKMIIEYETKRNDEFWKILTNMFEFQEFLTADCHHDVLYECLLNCFERNKKFEHAAKKYPDRANEFRAAIIPIEKVIEKYNQLQTKMKDNAILHFSCNTAQVSNLYDTNQFKRVDKNTLNNLDNRLEADTASRKQNYDNWINKGKSKKR